MGPGGVNQRGSLVAADRLRFDFTVPRIEAAGVGGGQEQQEEEEQKEKTKKKKKKKGKGKGKGKGKKTDKDSSALSSAVLRRAEALCRAAAAARLPVTVAEGVARETALASPAVRTVFGERYPAAVRVVSIPLDRASGGGGGGGGTAAAAAGGARAGSGGDAVEDILASPEDPRWLAATSTELCGGAHLAVTSEAGDFA